jgi:gluconate:H+ symporter, GntP family
MYGMPLAQASLLVAAAAVLIAAIQWRHLHPFLALVVVASAFGAAAGFSVGLTAKTFGSGFSQAVYSPGLVIIGAGFVAGLAESAAAFEALAALIDRRPWLRSTKVVSLVGLIAGIAASPASAFAILMPLLRAVDGGVVTKRKVDATALALAMSASHGLALLSPVSISAAAILGASLGRMALFGVPIVVASVVVGMAWARLVPVFARESEPLPQKLNPILTMQSGWPAIVLLLATAVPLLMLMIQSLGSMPDEPLGGGPAREMLLALGRPLVLLWASIGIMVIGLWRLSGKLLANSTWTGRMLANVSGTVLIIGAAGALQSLCQETGMSELLGERLLGVFGGLAVPFFMAAVIKTLQGSSVVAAIATAGIIQPILGTLGLADEHGKALAALAVGAGAMTVSHVNDPFFWLVTTSAGLSPLRGLATLAAGTLLQGVTVVIILLALSALASGI